MVGQINIICYSSCRDIVEELLEKLQNGGREPLLSILDSNKNLLKSSIKTKTGLNVLVLRQDDMTALKKEEWDDMPRQTTIRSGKGLSVAYSYMRSLDIPQSSICRKTCR